MHAVKQRTACCEAELTCKCLPGVAGALADQLQVIINELADKHNTPRFVPHVTVAGPIEDKSAEEVLQTFQEVGAALPVRSGGVCQRALLAPSQT